MTSIPTGTGRVLLTGATGQIGRRLLLALVQRGRAVTLVLRRPLAQEADLRAWLQTKGVTNADIVSVAGDLSAPHWGWLHEPADRMAWTQDIESVVHMAALWGWKLDPDEAEQANVQAPLSLWQQAWTWPRMTQFVMPIGYMSQHAPHMKALGLDLVQGPAVADVDWSRVTAQTGVYEASKLRAYWLMREEALQTGRPVSFIHPATVLGDMASPEVPESSAVAQLLSQLAQGKSPLVPGSRRHRVPLVSAGYVSAYVVALLSQPSQASMTEHLLLDSRTPDLLTTMRTLAKGQGVRSPYGRVPLPWVRCLAKVGPLARTMGLEPESLPFIIEGVFDVSKEDACAARWGVEHPDLSRLLQRTGEVWRATQVGV